MKLLRLLVVLLFLISFAKSEECKIIWDPPTETNVAKWRVFRGTELLCEVTTNAATIQLPIDVDSTITVYAVNSYNLISPPASITVFPVIPQDSGLLRTWRSRRAFFVEEDGSGKHFYRFALPTKNILLP